MPLEPLHLQGTDSLSTLTTRAKMENLFLEGSEERAPWCPLIVDIRTPQSIFRLHKDLRLSHFDNVYVQAKYCQIPLTKGLGVLTIGSYQKLLDQIILRRNQHPRSSHQ